MIYVSVAQKEQVARRLGNFGDKAPAVVARALNRAATETRTKIITQTREDYFVKAGDIRDTIRITKATPDRTRVVIKSRGTKRELAAFKVRPGMPNPKKPPPVWRVAVKRDGLKGFPGGFLIKGTSTGKLHVVTRVTSERYPIRIRYGPAVPQMIGQNLSKREYNRLIENEAEKAFNKRLEHEINRLLGG
ncbi:MAG: phage tail protein [Syntrophomonadaceae bacterium]|jgi:hypothetical protein